MNIVPPWLSSNCALFVCCFHRPQPLSEVVPRLWPFLCHSTSSVRRATLQTLRTLTTQRSVGNGMSWTAAVLQDALRHIFQRVIVEPIPEIQDLAEQVVHNFILCAFLFYFNTCTVRDCSDEEVM
jgi:hypothetical protein